MLSCVDGISTSVGRLEVAVYPKTPEYDMDDRFVEACQMLYRIEYLTDILTVGDLKERVAVVDELMKDIVKDRFLPSHKRSLDCQISNIFTYDYRFIDKEDENFAKLIMRAEASKKMLRIFFRFSDGRKIITPVFGWQSYLGFYKIDNGTNLSLIYEKNNKGISLKEIEMQETIKNINIDLLNN